MMTELEANDLLLKLEAHLDLIEENLHDGSEREGLWYQYLRAADVEFLLKTVRDLQSQLERYLTVSARESLEAAYQEQLREDRIKLRERYLNALQIAITECGDRRRNSKDQQVRTCFDEERGLETARQIIIKETPR